MSKVLTVCLVILIFIILSPSLSSAQNNPTDRVAPLINIKPTIITKDNPTTEVTFDISRSPANDFTFCLNKGSGSINCTVGGGQKFTIQCQRDNKGEWCNIPKLPDWFRNSQFSTTYFLKSKPQTFIADISKIDSQLTTGNYQVCGLAKYIPTDKSTPVFNCSEAISTSQTTTQEITASINPSSVDITDLIKNGGVGKVVLNLENPNTNQFYIQLNPDNIISLDNRNFSCTINQSCKQGIPIIYTSTRTNLPQIVTFVIRDNKNTVRAQPQLTITDTKNVRDQAGSVPLNPCKPTNTPGFNPDNDVACSTASGLSCDPNNPKNPGSGVLTAIGCIPTQPTVLIQNLLRVATGAGGGIALLLMVYGSFQMITSGGNPDNLKKGQEQFTSAVIGLLFIIFSVLLLQVIGFNILGIPGFGK